jgi:hypothetical protein
MTGTGRVWQKPELIVLSRSTAEEKVLSSCKTNSNGGTGYANFNLSCYWGVSVCYSCEGASAS